MPILRFSNSAPPPPQKKKKKICKKYGQMRIQLSDSVENIVEKGEIAHYEQFLLFPKRFQKLPVVDVYVWSKGLTS